MSNLLQTKSMGSQLKLHLGYSFFEKIRLKIGQIIVAGIFGAFIGAGIHFTIYENIRVWIGIVGIFMLGGLVKSLNLPIIYIDRTKKAVSKDGENWIPVNKNTKIYLRRRFSTRSSGGGETSKKTYYISRWSLLLENSESSEELLNHKVQEKSYFDKDLYDIVWLDQMAETIVNELGGAFIDETGAETDIITQEDTDKNLPQLLREEGIKPYTGNPSPIITDNFDIDNSGSTVTITEKGWNGKFKSFFGFLFLTVPLGIIYYWGPAFGLWYIDFSSPGKLLFQGVLMVFIIVGLYGFIFGPYKNQMDISFGEIAMRRQKLIGSSNNSSMPFNEIKDIQIIHPIGKDGIELVGRSHRFALVGGFSKEEVYELVNFIERIIVAKT